MNLSTVQSLFRYQRGRVIALGRVILASLFLLSNAFNRLQQPTAAFELLFAYVLVAVAIATITWRNWWLDARLAAPAHLLDKKRHVGGMANDPALQVKGRRRHAQNGIQHRPA